MQLVAAQAQVPRAATTAAVFVHPEGLRMHFQPIVDLVRGAVTGYEALARFSGTPSLAPDEWFRAAHAAGVGAELEARALAAALRARRVLPPDTFLTVNVSPAAVCSAPVQEVLAACGDLRGVVLEITEQQSVQDYDVLTASLRDWREAGARIAVDDAGAGFSSLAHITALRPELIKIDRGLVSNLDSDPTRAAVVETLGIFASRLDAWLLAEGVETARELERLLGLEVPLAQGYFLGRPTPAMAPVDVVAGTICRRHARRRAGGELLVLAQDARCLPEGAPAGRIAESLLAEPGDAWVVLVDEHHRPQALIHAVQGAQVRSAPLCVTAGDAVVDTARRMVARPEGERLTPVVVCDERGRVHGLIPVERLIERLADAAEQQPGLVTGR